MPPSVLPDISPTRGEIGLHIVQRPSCNADDGRDGCGEPISPRVGEMSGSTEGGAKNCHLFKPSHCSRHRVAVVRALSNQPQLWRADEPTGALDHASATALGQLLVELNQEESVTLIVVTHALDLAKRMAKVLELQDGKLVQR